MQRFVLPTILLVLLSTLVGAGSGAAPPAVRTLNGSGNNVSHPTLGPGGHAVFSHRGAELRGRDRAHGRRPVAAVRQQPDLQRHRPEPLLRERHLPVGLGLGPVHRPRHRPAGRDARGERRHPLRRQGPAEELQQRLRDISFARTPAAPGTGSRQPRQQVNTLSSFIDASNVYGVGHPARLAAGGPGRRQPDEQRARLLLPEGFLPRATRAATRTAPRDGPHGTADWRARDGGVAGDVRANENIALTPIHTLFAREHNRIVAALPASLSERAEVPDRPPRRRREIQYITYTEFLPRSACTCRLPGLRPAVNPSLSNEFAVVGYRAHSMVHGVFDPSVPAGRTRRSSWPPSRRRASASANVTAR